MKKLYPALTLLALIPLLFACAETEAEETRFDDPSFLEYACRLMPAGESEIQTRAAASTTAATLSGDIASIELTESGLYIIGRISSKTGETEYSYGHYSVGNGEYGLSGFGTLAFDNGRAGDVDVVITQRNGVPENVNATLTKATSSDPVYRTWYVEKTRMTVKGWTTVSVDFNGCNFPEIAEFLRKNGNKVPSEVPNHGISTITLTGTESMIIVYDDGSVELNEFSLAGNTLSYSWNEGALGFTFQSDRAVIDYMDGRCLLTLNGTIKNSTTSGSVTFVLVPMN